MNTNGDNMKDILYEDLERTYEMLLESTIQIVLGDLNAKYGEEMHFFPIKESECIHNVSNDNGLRIILFAASKDIVISITTFSHKIKH